MANEDKATRYHRLQRQASVLGTAAGAILLLVLLVSGGSAALRNAVGTLVGGWGVPTLIGYVLAVALLHEVIQLPLAYYTGVTLERRYGLSTQTGGAWWSDHLKAGGVGVLFLLFASAVVWGLLQWSRDYWWLLAAATFSALMVLLAQLAPVVLLPLFYEFKPLEREGLASRLIALADRAGAGVLGVFEWRLSDRTRKANAALTGIGRTRRILLSDTLLSEHSDDEIEVILAHELAHHVHRDIWTAMALESALIVVGFYVADRVLAAAVGHFGLTAKADVAALPLLALTGGAVSLLLKPLANAHSRAHERRADRFALDLTRNAAAFISAMRRLAAQNLAEERPSRLVEILFYTHPPTASRIDAARAWATKRAESP